MEKEPNIIDRYHLTELLSEHSNNTESMLKNIGLDIVQKEINGEVLDLYKIHDYTSLNNYLSTQTYNLNYLILDKIYLEINPELLSKHLYNTDKEIIFNKSYLSTGNYTNGNGNLKINYIFDSIIDTEIFVELKCADGCVFIKKLSIKKYGDSNNNCSIYNSKATKGIELSCSALLKDCAEFNQQGEIIEEISYIGNISTSSPIKILNSNLNELSYTSSIGDIKSSIKLDNVYIKSVETDYDTYIYNSVITKELKIVCVNSMMNNFELEDSSIEKFYLEQKTPLKKLSIINTDFESAEIKTTGKGLVSTKNINFRNLTFKDLDKDQALGLYRQMKYECEAIGYEHGVILFHALELETYYNLELKKKKFWSKKIPFIKPDKEYPEKFASKCHKLFTEYGTNLIRPLLSIFCLFLLFGIFNCVFYILNDVFDNSCMYRNIIISESFGYSFKNSFGPAYFAYLEDLYTKPIYPWAQLLGFIQVILTSIIWFLLIFMIRRRFKL